MSLIKLLTVSRSFVTGQVPAGRYRMVGREGGLPRFGPPAHLVPAPVAHPPKRTPVPCQREFPALGLPDAVTGEPVSPKDVPAADPGEVFQTIAALHSEVTAAVEPPAGCPERAEFRLEPEATSAPVGQGSSCENAHAADRSGSSRLPVVELLATTSPEERHDHRATPFSMDRPRSKSKSPFAKSNSAEPGSVGSSSKRAGLFQVLRGLLGWLRPKPGRNSKSPFVGKPVRPPVQAHLKLESVQVIRNDLSDSDYEVRQAGLAARVAAVNPPLLGRAKLSLATSWNQVTARWLAQGRARAQTR
jgi:hypothetical protein